METVVLNRSTEIIKLLAPLCDDHKGLIDQAIYRGISDEKSARSAIETLAPFMDNPNAPDDESHSIPHELAETLGLPELVRVLKTYI